MKLATFMTETGDTFYVNPEKVSSLHTSSGSKQQRGTNIAFAGDAEDYLFTPLGIEAVAIKLTEIETP